MPGRPRLRRAPDIAAMSRRAAALDTIRQLGLFEEPPAGAAAAPGAGPVPAAPPAEPAEPAPRAGGLAPAVFRHPQAAREIRLNDHIVADINRFAMFSGKYEHSITPSMMRFNNVKRFWPSQQRKPIHRTAVPRSIPL